MMNHYEETCFLRGEMLHLRRQLAEARRVARTLALQLAAANKRPSKDVAVTLLKWSDEDDQRKNRRFRREEV